MTALLEYASSIEHLHINGNVNDTMFLYQAVLCVLLQGYIYIYYELMVLSTEVHC